MVKTAFLFPGQGSQYIGMGKNCLGSESAKDLFQKADKILGYSLSTFMFDGPEEQLKQTNVTQPALFVASAAALELLKQHGIKPAVLGGHSLGEYSALYAAGVFDFETGLRLVNERAKAMQEAAAAKPGAMAAILGLDGQIVRKICEDVSGQNTLCVPANFNSESQIVVSGEEAGVVNVMEEAQKAGAAKVIRLNVSGAFHSPLMSGAAQKMKEKLDQARLADSAVPVIANVDAQPTTTSQEIKRKLVEQIDHPVRWHETLQWMIASEIDVFIEVGAGKVLSAMVKKMDRKKTVVWTDDFESILKIISATPAN